MIINQVGGGSGEGAIKYWFKGTPSFRLDRTSTYKPSSIVYVYPAIAGDYDFPLYLVPKSVCQTIGSSSSTYYYTWSGESSKGDKILITRSNSSSAPTADTVYFDTNALTVPRDSTTFMSTSKTYSVYNYRNTSVTISLQDITNNIVPLESCHISIKYCPVSSKALYLANSYSPSDLFVTFDTNFYIDPDTGAYSIDNNTLSLDCAFYTENTMLSYSMVDLEITPL